jgi:L-alanine-DL-glutamate epimerase-like enolase superfamily enzyme
MVLEKRAADYIMIDPTWVGGISQTHRLAHQAQTYNIPVVMHDCTGPLTMLSGVQVATATANVVWQETVRAHIHLIYPHLITEQPVIEAGHVLPPQQPGIGTAWLDSLFSGPGLRVSEG